MAGLPAVKLEPGSPAGSSEKYGGVVSCADIKISLPHIKRECLEYSTKAVQEMDPTEDCSRKVVSSETMDGVARAPAVKPEPGSAAGSGDEGAGGGVPYTDIDISLPDIKQECLEYSRKYSDQHSGSLSSEQASPGPPPGLRDSSAQTSRTRVNASHRGLHPGLLFACTHCPFTSSVLRNVNTHELTHAPKRLSCPRCSYATFRRTSFRIHLLTHTGEKLFSCAHCSYACNYKSQLKSHLLSHKADAPFSCPRCSYKSNLETSFNKHIRRCIPT